MREDARCPDARASFEQSFERRYGMNGIWFRALLVSVFTVSPLAVASAQQTPPANENVDAPKKDEKAAAPAKDDEAAKKKAEEKKDEATPDDQAPADADKAADEAKPVEETKPADEAAPVDEAKPADDAAPADEAAPVAEPKPADAPAPEATPAAEPAPAPEAAPIETPAPAGGLTPTAGDQGVVAPQISAEANPETPSKPWSVTANLGLSLGAAFLTSNGDTRSPSFGWSIDTSGKYTLTKLLDGNLDGFIRLAADQVLANTLVDSAVGQTKQYEFFFRDLRLGVTEAGLYKEPVTGISLSASTEFFLPTSKLTIAAKRWLRWGVGARLGRTFEKLGPGDLSLALGTTFRKDFSARQVNFDKGSAVAQICRVTNIKNGECIGNQRNSNFTFINDLGISYIWGPVTVGVSLAIYSVRYFAQNNGEDPAGVEVTKSPYVTDNTWLNLTLAEVAVAYAFNDNWTLGADITTYQSPYIYSGSSNGSLRFPFFDTASTAENFTTFDLTLTFVY